MNPWPWIIALGIGTFAIRASFLLPRRGSEPSAYTKRVLGLVPAAVLSALATPALFYVDGAFTASWTNDRLVAGAIAVIVAWRSRNVMITLVVGMVVFWSLRLIG